MTLISQLPSKYTARTSLSLSRPCSPHVRTDGPSISGRMALDQESGAP